MTRSLPPFPATPLGSLSAFNLQKCNDYWPKVAGFVAETGEQCLEAVRARFDDPDPCIAYFARVVAYGMQAKPDFFWSSDEIGRNEVERLSLYLVELENGIAHLDDAQEVAVDLPADLAALASACGHLLRVIGALADLAFVFEVGNLFEVDGLLTFVALATRLDAALEATQSALLDAKLLAPHVAYSICAKWRPHVFEAIFATGFAIGEQYVRALDPYAFRAFLEGGPANFITQNPENTFRKQLAIIRSLTSFSRDKVFSDLVAAVNSEASERRRLHHQTVLSGDSTALAGQVSKPKLHHRQQEALALIRETPGMKAVVIARHLDIKENTFLSHYVPKLKLHGVRNEGDGYVCDTEP